jgi:NADPH-dependent curcumin reductase CurA
MSGNKQILLAERPDGALETSHFQIRDGAMPEPKVGEILVRTILLSLDAANRAWMQGATYREAVNAGDVMHSYSIAEVVTSKADGFKAGDLVGAETGWQEYAALPPQKVSRLPDHRPLSNLLSILGVAGKTAYHGLVELGQPKSGETLVVSAAAGSVGSYVGPMAKALGCRAVGIAGGTQKCDWLVEELGFDAAVDYKSPSFFKDLKMACPGGIDVYFDNTGGKILEACLFQMNGKGRVVCCGAVSQYNTKDLYSPRGVPGLLVTKRIRMEGFIVSDFAAKDNEAEKQMMEWAAEGKIKVLEDILQGLESAPGGLVGLLGGENRGKRMIRVAPDPEQI